ncbi:hypothetical protein AB1Y20_022143 [Prymnesium parvum]|uniref:C3H1-type domain-containing protein n=1 Tax=Prymnesium parvum TaxID=97485 RepID=A0AB34JIH3_PRYPA
MRLPQGSTLARPPLPLVVACTFDPFGFQAPLRLWFDRFVGLPTTLHWMGYGTAVEMLCDVGSAWNANGAGVNVLVLRLADLTPTRDPPPDLARRTLASLAHALAASSAARRGKTVVLLPPPDDGAPELTLRAELAARLCAVDGVQLVDGAPLLAALPGRFYCRFLDVVAHAPYSPAAMSALAAAAARQVARALGVTRKVVCLDCDGTLWRGAVGELGVGGVQIDECFVRAQRFFVRLQQRGLLLCLCTRNDEADVRAVLEQRQDELALRLEHVVAIKANWQAKSTNIVALADSLCLDLSTFIFVDDSPVECAEVAAACGASGLTVVQLPREPEHYAAFLEEHWAFDLPPLSSSKQTDEDSKRTVLYRELAERKKYAQEYVSNVSSQSLSASSMDAFVASLNLRTNFAPLSAHTIERAAQLTERTNQHNACKWPLTPARLELCAQRCACTTVEASDRFGHHGLVGLIAVENDLVEVAAGWEAKWDAASGESLPMQSCGGTAEGWEAGDESGRRGECGGSALALHVRGWLLSCRSLHIGIEFMMLRHLASVAKARGADWLAVHWRRSERNEPAAAFFFSLPGVRFEPCDESLVGLRPLDSASEACVEPNAAGSAPKGSPPLERQATPPEAEARTPRSAEQALAAAEAAVVHAIEHGVAPPLRDLPTSAELESIDRPTRRKLCHKLEALASKAREGAFARPRARQQLKLHIRGRIGLELCVHSLRGGCSMAECPFVHPRRSEGRAAAVRVALSLRGGWVAAQMNAAPVEPSRSPLPSGGAAPAAAAPAVQKTYGVVSQYKQRERPEAGVIFVPVHSAESAQVGFSHHAGAEKPSTTATHAAQEASAAASSQRVGFVTKSGSVTLHHETYRDIALALACHASEVHQWVASECERLKCLPESFREVWERVAAGDELLAAADDEDPPYEVSAMSAGLGEVSGEKELHARLRRQIRHSMHLMMQQANPGTYYAEIEHMAPT